MVDYEYRFRIKESYDSNKVNIGLYRIETDHVLWIIPFTRSTLIAYETMINRDADTMEKYIDQMRKDIPVYESEFNKRIKATEEIIRRENEAKQFITTTNVSYGFKKKE